MEARQETAKAQCCYPGTVRVVNLKVSGPTFSDVEMKVLFYTILYYTILYYTILYYTILYYTILYYTILYYTILYYTILYDTILYCLKSRFS